MVSVLVELFSVKCFPSTQNINVFFNHYQVCEEQSSSEVASSEEEYVPDSTADSSSSWDGIAEPLKISRRHLELQNCEVCTSKSASKKKRHHQESFVEEERESVSEAAESLSEDAISASQLEVSGVIAKVGNADAEGIIVDDSAGAEQVSNTSSSLKNKTYCYICGKLQTKFTRHLKRHEKTHADVAQALSLPKKSKRRQKMLIKLRNKGKHIHNSEVLASGVGSLKLRRTAKTKYNAKDYIHCIYCQAPKRSVATC